MTLRSYRKCKVNRCTRRMDTTSKWSQIRAHDNGWTMLRNGEVYCPEHMPQWAKHKRALKESKK